MFHLPQTERRENIETFIVNEVFKKLTGEPEKMDQILMQALPLIIPFIDSALQREHPFRNMIRKRFREHVQALWSAYFPDIPNPFNEIDKVTSVSDVYRAFIKKLYQPENQEYRDRIAKRYMPHRDIYMDKDLLRLVEAIFNRVLFYASIKLLRDLGYLLPEPTQTIIMTLPLIAPAVLIREDVPFLHKLYVIQNTIHGALVESKYVIDHCRRIGLDKMPLEAIEKTLNIPKPNTCENLPEYLASISEALTNGEAEATTEDIVLAVTRLLSSISAMLMQVRDEVSALSKKGLAKTLETLGVAEIR